MSIESVLKLNNLYFNKIEFNRNEKISKKIQPEFDVKFDYIEEKRVKVALSCKVSSDGDFDLFVSLIGDFSIAGEAETDFKQLLQKNTTAILFPYLRAEITLLTTQPNMPVINIPPININALLDHLEAKE